MRLILEVSTFNILFRFARPVKADNYPAFVVRSVLGEQLRKIHCVAPNAKCSSCLFRENCPYFFLFESEIEKDNPALPGRDHASHPFRLICRIEPGTLIEELKLEILLFGKATEYSSNILYALSEAGRAGLFKQRVPFQVAVLHGATGHYASINEISELPRTTEFLNFPEGTDQEQYSLTVLCRTPLRFKRANRYASNFSGQDFMLMCKRRVQTLFALYGSFDRDSFDLPYGEINVAIPEKALIWKDYLHYSSRQKNPMKMGGVVGNFLLEGTAPAWAWQAVRICASTGTGKSTSFGFGDIRIVDNT